MGVPGLPQDDSSALFPFLESSVGSSNGEAADLNDQSLRRPVDSKE